MTSKLTLYIQTIVNKLKHNHNIQTTYSNNLINKEIYGKITGRSI